MGQEEVVDALVLAARWDEQQLSESSRRVITQLESVSRLAQKLDASGQKSPASSASADITQATAAFRAGKLSLEGYNVALQQAKIELIALREAGYKPNEKQLLLLDTAIERTTKALAQQASVAARAAQEARGLGDAVQNANRKSAGTVDPFSKTAKGGAGFAAGLARARSGLAQVAVTAVGTSSAIGQVVQSVLLLSGIGVGGIIAISAAVAIAAKAFDLLTESTRKAKEEHKKLIEAGKETVRSGEDTGVRAQSNAAAKDAIDLALKRIDIEDNNHASILREIALRRNANQLIEAATLALQLQGRVQAENAQRQRALDETTIDAVQAVNQVRSQGAQDAIQFQLELAKAQGTQTFSTTEQPVSDQVLQSFRDRLALVQANAKADLSALQIKLADRQADIKAPGLSRDQRDDIQGQIDALQQSIDVRKAELQVQVAQINNERTLAIETEKRSRANDIADFQKRLTEAGHEAENAGLATARAWGDDAFQGIEKAAGAMDDFRKNTREATDGLMSAQEIIDEFANSLADSMELGTAGPEQFDAIRTEMERQLNIAQDQTRALSERNAAMQLYNRLVQASRAPGERLARTLGDVAFVVDSIGDALGGMDAQAQQAFRSLTSLGQSLATGDIFGAIGSGIGLLGSIFGGGQPSEQELIRAQNELTLATERNTAAVEKASTAGGIAETQDTLRKALGGDLGSLIRQQEANPIGGKQAAQELDRALRDAGSSLEELQAIAKENGIELLDSKGRLVAGALDQLDEKLRLAAEAAQRLDDSIPAQRSRDQTRQDLGLAPDRSSNPDVAKLQQERDIQLQGLELDPALEAKIKALDLSTVEGRKAFLAFEQDLFKRATTGGLTDKELHDFDVNTLIDSTDIAAGAINDLGDSAKDAASKLGDFDLPPGFKRAALVFANEATGPSRPSDGAQQPLPPRDPLRGTDLIPNLPDEIQVKLPPKATTEPAVKSTTNVQPGAVTVQITVNGAGDPAKVAQAVKLQLLSNLDTALRKIGFVQSGDTTQLGLR